jgi:hypothetical protein
MIGFIIGLVVGVLVAGIAVWLYDRYKSEAIRRERNFLQNRLRSVLALLDGGLLKAEDPEVRKMLVDTQEMLAEGIASEVPAEALSGDGAHSAAARSEAGSRATSPPKPARAAAASQKPARTEEAPPNDAAPAPHASPVDEDAGLPGIFTGEHKAVGGEETAIPSKRGGARPLER